MESGCLPRVALRLLNDLCQYMMDRRKRDRWLHRERPEAPCAVSVC